MYIQNQWGQDLSLSRSSLTPDIESLRGLKKESECKLWCLECFSKCFSSKSPLGKCAEWFFIIPDKSEARDRLG